MAIFNPSRVNATRFDHQGWNQETKQTCHSTLMRYVKRLDVSALDYVYSDCKAVVDALPHSDKAGHYVDTMHYIAMRRNGHKL